MIIEEEELEDSTKNNKKELGKGQESENGQQKKEIQSKPVSKKKTQMYMSNISNAAYDFVDFTSANYQGVEIASEGEGLV